MLEKVHLLDLERHTLPKSLPSQLEPFEVVVEEPPSIYKRLRTSLWPPSIWTIGAIFFDIICAVYQSFESYKEIYPGSKIAANILLTNGTLKAWETFLWIFVVLATVCNVMLTRTIWFKWLWGLGRLLKSNILQYIYYSSFSLITFFLVLTGAIWIQYLIRGIWATNAWDNVCEGWDIMANIDGISYTSFNRSPPIVATATITAAQGQFFLHLLHRNSSVSQYNLSADSFHSKPPFAAYYSNITYNSINTTYTISNISNSYYTVPNLSFPSLGLELRDSSIPFTRPTMRNYPPSADLVRRNGSITSNVLQTVMTQPGDCTQLAVCGMNSYMPEFQIALGVIMIEQFKSGIYCTLPDGSIAPNL